MPVTTILTHFIGVVFATAFTHWSLVNLYTYLCAPLSIFGPVKTLLNLGSPMCQFLNFIQYEIAKHYITIWGGAGLASIGWIIKQFKT